MFSLHSIRQIGAKRPFALFSSLALIQALFFCYLFETLATRSQAAEVLVSSKSTIADERGFEPLLGKNAKQLWRGYAKEGWPQNWSLEKGVLARVGDGGDIMTTEEFDSFELRLEWKISPGGNSGILYHVSQGDPQPYFTGIECQVLDDDKHPDGKNKLTSASSLYAMYARKERATSPVGEWNQARIIVRGNHIEHWLGGKKMIECERDSKDWKERLAKSKFSTWEKFAKNHQGHISLQDHHDPVWYRNIRIKRLAEKK